MRIRTLRACITMTTGLAACWCLAGCKNPWRFVDGGFADPRKQFVAPPAGKTPMMAIQETVSLADPARGLLPNADFPTPEDLEVVEQDYTLGPRDIIEVAIMDLYYEGRPEVLRREVSETGYIRVPLIPDQIKVAGLTSEEVRQKLISLYRPSILLSPNLSVQLLTRQKNKFTLSGYIQRPGTYQILSMDLRLTEALGMGGDVLSPQVRYVYVFRPRPTAAEELAEAPGTTAAGEPAATRPGLSPETRQQQRQQALQEFEKALEQLPTEPAHPSQILRLTEMAERPGAVPTSAMAPVANAGEQKMKWVYDKDRKEWTQAPAEELATESQPAAQTTAAPPTESSPATSRPAPAPAEETASAPAPPREEYDPFHWQEAANVDGIRIIAIDLEKLRRGDPRMNIIIRNQDVVHVPPIEQGYFYMAGDVARSGAYELTGRKITILQAVAAAGGLAELAWPRNTLLIRRVGDNEQQIIPLNLEAIMRNEQPDIFLKPNDTIAVGSDACAPFLAVIRNAFRLSYGGGFIYDRNFGQTNEGPLNSMRFSRW